MVSIQLLGMTQQEMRVWLKEKYPTPLEVVLYDKWGNYDYTCMDQHGWCIDWNECPELSRCPHGKAQSRINWPSPKEAALMTQEERVEWQKRNFPKKLVEFEIPGAGTFYCTIYGWCIKEQFKNCLYTEYCPEYWQNKPKWREKRYLKEKD